MFLWHYVTRCVGAFWQRHCFCCAWSFSLSFTYPAYPLWLNADLQNEMLHEWRVVSKLCWIYAHLCVQVALKKFTCYLWLFRGHMFHHLKTSIEIKSSYSDSWCGWCLTVSHYLSIAKLSIEIITSTTPELLTRLHVVSALS